MISRSHFFKCIAIPLAIPLVLGGLGLAFFSPPVSQLPLKEGNRGVVVAHIQISPPKSASLEVTPAPPKADKAIPQPKIDKPLKTKNSAAAKSGEGLPEEEAFDIEKLPKLADSPLFSGEVPEMPPETAGIPEIPDESAWPPLKPWETLIAYLVDSKGVIIDAVVLKSSGRNLLDETLLAKGSMTMTLYSKIDPPIPEGQYQWFLEKYTIGSNAILP